MTDMTADAEALTMEAIEQRRQAGLADEVVFAVRNLYGLSSASVELPLSDDCSIDSGQVCVTMDPDAGQAGNIGVINFRRGTLKVRYAVQAVFPGLNDLVSGGHHDPRLQFPVRIVATDDCTLTPEFTGWHALGCLDFLPGSIWAGASGG